MELPETRYARSGDVSIAYQVLGDGPFDLVRIPPYVSHVALACQIPSLAAFNRELASVAELKGVPGEWRLYAVDAASA